MIGDGDVCTPSALPTEVVPGFLFIGSFDHASRADLLKTLGITHVLNVRYMNTNIRLQTTPCRIEKWNKFYYPFYFANLSSSSSHLLHADCPYLPVSL